MNLKTHFRSILAHTDGQPLPDHATVTTRAGYVREALAALESLNKTWNDPTARTALAYFPLPTPAEKDTEA